MLGSMGLAIPIALGVALAQRERGLVTLEGDGNRIRRGSFSRRRYCRLQSAASLMDGEVVDGPGKDSCGIVTHICRAQR